MVKDLITKITSFKEVHNNAQTVVRAFKTAHLQYARLRELQVQLYGKKQALCLSVITRWGTQIRLLASLIKNKDAIRRYTTMYTPKDLGVEAFEYAASYSFWAEVERLYDMLKPIDEVLKMSESSKGHLGMVVDRWDTIVTHLERQGNLGDFLQKGGHFEKRYITTDLSLIVYSIAKS